MEDLKQVFYKACVFTGLVLAASIISVFVNGAGADCTILLYGATACGVIMTALLGYIIKRKEPKKVEY